MDSLEIESNGSDSSDISSFPHHRQAAGEQALWRKKDGCKDRSRKRSPYKTCQQMCPGKNRSCRSSPNPNIHESPGREEQLLIDKSESSFPYSSDALENLLQAHGQRGVNIAMLLQENEELHRKMAAMCEQERLEADRLRREENNLTRKITLANQSKIHLKGDIDMYVKWNDDLDKTIRDEKKIQTGLKKQLENERDKYESNRTRLADLTAEIHDEIRFRTAGIGKTDMASKGYTLSCKCFKIFIPNPFSRWRSQQSRKARRVRGFSEGMILESFELLAPVILVLALLLLFYVSGMFKIDCKYSMAKLISKPEEIKSTPDKQKDAGAPPKDKEKEDKKEGQEKKDKKGKEAEGKDSAKDKAEKGKEKPLAKGGKTVKSGGKQKKLHDFLENMDVNFKDDAEMILSTENQLVTKGETFINDEDFFESQYSIE